ncbi:hypothetical protein N7466_005259 [Penicillium verhagenii]|uniref:uncharacterized protein n=1 Tax=Penicillium verhagenii TaxID=1562060 RepID=UPI0025456588|nr:uncharacterized protein N7466_005259 [Penicillium verhagenii]KAJ5935712.1 hypothetical protein N7466_005259 [Penicillium verhagenii]
MPAPISEDMQPELHLNQLEAVGKAFDALLLTLYRLTNRHNELKQYTEDIFKQYTNVTRQLPPQDRPHAMEVQQRLLDQQKELCLGLVHNKPRIEEQSLNSMHVIKTLVSHQNVDENATRAIVAGVKGYKALLRTQDGLSQMSSTNSCMFVRGPDPVYLEEDFTTNGAQGSLHCPFSKPKTPSGSEALNGTNDGPKIQVDTCGHENLDPIKAEQDERRSSTTPSVRTSGSRCPVSRCPIRYLDKHSPEEIAEYVERHKHEIPRSHAICVKRYQRDPQNMRQLDAKYGGLINMISGLSAKHQAFLPGRQGNGDGDGQTTSVSTERVEKWAENVDPANPGPPPDEDENRNEDEGSTSRDGRFERPLREVRLGESPSRPWGIHVPITQQTNASVPFSGLVPGPMSPESHVGPHETPPTDIPAKPAGRCPFGHGAPKPEAAEPVSAAPPPAAIAPEPERPTSPLANWAKHAQAATADADAQKIEDTTAKADAIPTPSHITFNGPVFFGYSAEQTASLMQQLRKMGAQF